MFRLAMKKDFILHSVFLAAMVSVITLQPYYMHGAINYYESGIYLSCIQSVFNGLVPYRDMYILRGPLEIYFPAALMEILGKHIAILNAYFYFGTVLTLIICAYLGMRMYRTRVFVYLMVLVLVGKTFARINFNNWGGIRFGIGLLAILFTVSYFKKARSLWIFLAGVFSAIGFFISFEIGICSAIAVLASLFIAAVLKKQGIRLKAAWVYILGASVAALPFVIYFLITGAIPAFFDILWKTYRNMIAVFTFPERFYSPKNFYEFILGLNPFNRNIKYTVPFFIYLAAGVYLLRKFLTKRSEPADYGILSLGIYGAIMYKSVFRNIEGPPFQMALQPAVILLFLLLERLYLFLKKKRLNLGRVFIVIVVLLSVGYSIQRYNHRFFIFKYRKEFFVKRQGVKILFPDTAYSTLDIERARGIVVPWLQAEEIEDTVRYIQSRTAKDEPLFTFPDLGTYNFLADRPCLGRFGTVELSWISEDWHKEVMKELDSRKPRYALMERDISRLDPYISTVGRYIGEIKTYMNLHYAKEVSYGSIDIWRRK